MNIQEAAAFLRDHDGYLIITHVRPDGDTVGCAAGLCRALRRLGREAWVLPNPQITPPFQPLLEGLTAPEGYVPRTVVTVDIAARNMIPESALPYCGRVDLAVDHHPSQSFFAEHTCLDAGRASCGEIILKIVRELGPLTAETAEPLYVAVSTDCGCFVYSNTDAACHRAAAELIETGIDVYALNRKHFRSKSMVRLKFESALLERLELRDGGATGIVTIPLSLLQELGTREEDVEGASAFVGEIEGIRTGATLRELEEGVWKLSLRTDPGDLDACRVCALLGGGGHAAASGATMYGVTMESARQKLLDAVAAVRAGG